MDDWKLFVLCAGLSSALMLFAWILDRRRREVCDNCERKVRKGKRCECGYLNEPAYFCLQCGGLNLNKPDADGFAPCVYCGERTHQQVA